MVHSPKSSLDSRKGAYPSKLSAETYISSIRYPLSYMLTQAQEAQQEIGAHGLAIQKATNEPPGHDNGKSRSDGWASSSRGNSRCFDLDELPSSSKV